MRRTPTVFLSVLMVIAMRRSGAAAPVDVGQSGDHYKGIWTLAVQCSSCRDFGPARMHQIRLPEAKEDGRLA